MNFIKLKPLFIIISLVLITTSILSIVFWGFEPSIDFTGGSVWELSLPSKPEKKQVETVFDKQGITISSLIIKDDNYQIDFINITTEQKETLNQEIKIVDKDYQELKFETLGPLLGKELIYKTIIAIILSTITILLFISYRFKDFHFGLAAVLALVHDVIILLGSFSILGHFFKAEFNSLFVTAILTTLSLSVYDTVVIFDRIRELRFKYLKLDWNLITNNAVAESLTRSINTSATTAFTLTALVLLGGDTTRWFATALLVGVVFGTYSSIGVAIPLVIFFKKHSKKK